MKTKNILMIPVICFLMTLIGCGQNDQKNWEYKVSYYDAQLSECDDKNYMKSTESFRSSVSNKSVIPDEASLNLLGKQGWEMVNCYLQQETVFPNLLASGSGVNGLQPNIRPYRLVVIYKRLIVKK